MGLTFCVLRSVKMCISKQLLTLRAHHAQQRQVAQVLKSEQPHLDENSRQPTRDWSDRIGMRQKRQHATSALRGAKSPIMRRHPAARTAPTPRSANCDSKQPGRRPLDCLRFRPAGTRFAQRNADCCSCHIKADRNTSCNPTAISMTRTSPRLRQKMIPIHEAVKFNATVHRAAANDIISEPARPAAPRATDCSA